MLCCTHPLATGIPLADSHCCANKQLLIASLVQILIRSVRSQALQRRREMWIDRGRLGVVSLEGNWLFVILELVNKY